MERIKFISKIYLNFLGQYIFISFICMYILGYGIVIIQDMVKNKEFYNSFTSYIETSTTQNQHTERTPHKIQYYIIYKRNNQLYKLIIPKEKYIILVNKTNNYFLTNDSNLKINSNEIMEVTFKVLEERQKSTYEKKSQNIVKDLNSKQIQKKHIEHIKNIYTDLIMLIIFFVGLVFYLFKKSELLKYILLPYDNNLFENFGTEKHQRKVYLKFQTITKNGDLIYKNKSKSMYEKIIKIENDIRQYLKIENIEIERKDDKSVIIRETTIPKLVNFNKNIYQKNLIYFGKSNLGKDINIDLNNLNHTLLIGKSGKGKSVNIQNILNSCFYNLDEFETIYLVDFKKVEFSRYLNLNSKVKVITDLKEFCDTVIELDKIMEERYTEREKVTGTTDYIGKKIIMIIDEFRDLENVLKVQEEKLYKSNQKLLLKLLRKRRSSKIFLIFSGQRRTKQEINPSIVNNIQTHILMGSDDNYTITNIGGTIEYLSKYNLSPTKFTEYPTGRMFYKNTLSGERFQIQSPFFDVNDEEHRFYMFRLLGLEDNMIKQKIERIKFINQLKKQYENYNITKEDLLKSVKEFDINQTKKNQ